MCWFVCFGPFTPYYKLSFICANYTVPKDYISLSWKDGLFHLRWNADFPLKGKFCISKDWIDWYLQNHSWLNLEHWKRSNPRIVSGLRPVTFLFDSALEREKKNIHFKLLFSQHIVLLERRIGVDSGVGLKTIASLKWSISLLLCWFKGASVNKCLYWNYPLLPL